MDAESFREALAAVLTEAMQSDIPLDEIIGAMEICKVMAITEYMTVDIPQNLN